jgi:sugar (pentulose or hexulose) kinase
MDITEVHRFQNGPIKTDQSLQWDIDALFAELKTGLRKVLTTEGTPSGIGIDTWGVDYGIVGSKGKFIRNPYHYRDSRTEGIAEKVYRIVSEKELYSKTGIQFLPFNTIFQLFAHKIQHPEDLRGGFMLTMPDALYYLFIGKVSCEYTHASTSGLLNANKRNWDWNIISKLGFDKKIFSAISFPCSSAGHLSSENRKELSCGGINFYHVGSHDTASAVAAAPAVEDSPFAYISCGTWALLGTELKNPILSEDARKSNYTNEGGVDGRIRFLTNITGLWLLQECKRNWDAEGKKYSYAQMTEMTEISEPMKFLVNPANPKFLSPRNMSETIKQYCAETGQGQIHDDASVVRCVIDSLALCFRIKIEELEKLCSTQYRKVHIIGGGCQNKPLMQCAADCMQRDVYAGPVEATAIGNIMTQAIALGEIRSLSQGRKIVAESFPLDLYKPAGSLIAKMEKALPLFRALP